MKDPATSAIVDMTSSVTQYIKRFDKGLEKPITTVWAEGDKDKRQERVGAVRMEDEGWKI